ncbi:MAG: hypothetical protein JWQ44_1872 [Chthoniobacter sp.]|jgi:hypothetical protein|nr:hypothetical protein [Chthoniobacter sp.]
MHAPMKFLPLLLAGALLHASSLAQAPVPPTPSGTQAAIPLFRATLPGGTYEVAVRAIIAVTSHEYLIDGAVRVTEVNIDTSGSLLARFYYLEVNKPNTPLGIGSSGVEQAERLLKEGADKTGQDVWKRVVKNYPTTTHARTVEYRVENLEQLTKIYDGAEQALRLQRDMRVTIEK